MDKELPEGFKMTEIGMVPVEWDVVRLGDVADYINGYAFKPNQWKKKGKPIIRIQNLTHSSDDVNYYDGEIKEKYKIKKGDMLISWSASLGVFKWIGENAWLNQHIFKVDNYHPHIWKDFLYYVVMTKIRSMKTKTHGSTMHHITKKEFLAVEVPLPPLPEQRRIAAVLSSVQDARDRTEGVIQAAKELKKSMMTHLFTYGPVPVEQADGVPMKETDIGMVPEGWDVVRLGDVTDLIMGQSPPGSTYNKKGNGIPFLQGKAEFGDMHPRHIKFTTDPKKIAPPHSILMSVRAPVGDVNIADIEYCIGRGLGSISLINGDNQYLFYNLTFIKPSIKKEGTGSTFKAINKSKLEDVQVPFPPLPEQRRIADMLSSVDEKIQLEEDKKKALDDLFKTLLNDLMTAKIRVNDLEVDIDE